jgi:dynein heavy chain 1
MFGPAATTSAVAIGGGAASSGVYEGLHRLVHFGVAPAFEAFVESKGKKEGARRRADDSKDADTKMGIPMTKKKFAELELSLLHRQSPLANRPLRLSTLPGPQ